MGLEAHKGKLATRGKCSVNLGMLDEDILFLYKVLYVLYDRHTEGEGAEPYSDGHKMYRVSLEKENQRTSS
jgi:hypothetical protein